MSTAFRAVTTGRPGPAYIDLPSDILSDPVDEDLVSYPTGTRTAARPGGDPAQIKEAAELLAKAKKPIIIAGTGTFWSQSGP